MESLLLKEKIALVTGSSRGIGRAIALLFVREVAKVVLHGRDETALAAVQAEIERDGGRAMRVTADITKFGEIEEMRTQIEQTFGGVGILVANAGGNYTMPGPLEEISEEGWHRSIDGNLTDTFLTIKSILPGMKQRRSGAIITISLADRSDPRCRRRNRPAMRRGGENRRSRDNRKAGTDR